MSKKPKLDLAQAMEAELKSHDPMGPRIPSSPYPNGSRDHATTVTPSRGPLSQRDLAPNVPQDQAPMIRSSQEIMAHNENMNSPSHGSMGPSSHETMGQPNSPRSPIPPSRQGMKRISGYFSPRVLKQMRLLAATQDCSVDELVARALNMLFTAEGLPAIAFDQKEKGRGPA